ncbi:hypothetical protein BD309DRAFT_969088, partial [Dichomitus squalens]
MDERTTPASGRHAPREPTSVPHGHTHYLPVPASPVESVKTARQSHPRRERKTTFHPTT